MFVLRQATLFLLSFVCISINSFRAAEEINAFYTLNINEFRLWSSSYHSVFIKFYANLLFSIFFSKSFECFNDKIMSLLSINSTHRILYEWCMHFQKNMWTEQIKLKIPRKTWNCNFVGYTRENVLIGAFSFISLLPWIGENKILYINKSMSTVPFMWSYQFSLKLAKLLLLTVMLTNSICGFSKYQPKDTMNSNSFVSVSPDFWFVHSCMNSVGDVCISVSVFIQIHKRNKSKKKIIRRSRFRFHQNH